MPRTSAIPRTGTASGETNHFVLLLQPGADILSGGERSGDKDGEVLLVEGAGNHSSGIVFDDGVEIVRVGAYDEIASQGDG
jgi:hypothetical protein